MVEYSAARCGALILGRYRHPGDWLDGAAIGEEYADMYVLRVNEIQRGPSAGQTSLEADANTFAVQSWAEYVSLIPPEFGISAATILVVEGEIYLAIPQIYWGAALPKLQELTTDR